MAKQSDVKSQNENLYRKNGRKIPAKQRKMDDNGTWFYRFDQNRFIIDNIMRFNEDKELVNLLKEYRKNNKDYFNNNAYFFKFNRDITIFNDYQISIFLADIIKEHVGKDFLKDITLSDNSKLIIKDTGDMEVWAREPETKNLYDPHKLDLDLYKIISYVDYERDLIIINMIEDESPKMFNLVIKSLDSIDEEEIKYNEEEKEIQIKFTKSNLRKVLTRCNSRTFKIILPFSYNYEGFDEEHSIVLDKFSKTYIKQIEKEEYDTRQKIGGQPYHLRPENRPYFAKRRKIKDWEIFEVFDENKDGYKLFSVKDKTSGVIYLVYYTGKDYHGKGILKQGKNVPGLQDPSNYRKAVKIKDIYYSVLMTQAKYNLMKKNKFDLYTSFDSSKLKYLTAVDKDNNSSTDFLDNSTVFKIRQITFDENKLEPLKDKFIKDYE